MTTPKKALTLIICLSALMLLFGIPLASGSNDKETGTPAAVDQDSSKSVLEEDLRPLPGGKDLDSDLGLLPVDVEDGGDLLSRKAEKITIAVVRDGPSELLDKLYDMTKKEIELLSEGDFQPVFLDVEEYSAGWKVDQVDGVLKKALNNPKVDIVLSNGVLTTLSILKYKKLKKPVVTGFLLAGNVLGYQVDGESHSTKENFTGVFIPNRMQKDLKAIKRLFKFDRLHVLVDKVLMDGWKSLDKDMAPIFQEAGIRDVQIKPMSDNASETLSQLGDDILVYVTTPVRMSDVERKALFEGFKRKKIKSYSMLGGEDVDRGALACILPNINERLARRVALNVQSIAMGESPNDLPTDLEVVERMTLNARTAKAVGYSPTFEISLRVRYVDMDVEEGGHIIDLASASFWTANNNIEMAIQEYTTQGAMWDRKKVGSHLWPQLEMTGQYVQVDRDRADASNGSLPISKTTGAVTLTQVLFNDEILSNFRASGKNYWGKVFEEQALTYDLMAKGASAFLTYLSARALFRIEAENLNLIEKNLDLARARVRVGISGREEVLRLETEEAGARSSLFEAESKMQMARVALNQLLGTDQETRWQPQDVDSKDGEQVYLNVALFKYLKNMVGIQMLGKFLTYEAIDNAPELQTIYQAIEAQEIILGQLKRRYYVPSLSAQVEYSRLIDDVEGADQPLSSIKTPGLRFEEPDKDDWSLALVLKFPIFEGFGRKYDIRKATADLYSLRKKRVQIMQMVEQRVRNAVLAMSHSAPTIELTRIAAEKAAENLKIVQDKYARGTSGLIDLLDAQNQALVQEQSAAIAEYNYLKDYVELQRAAGWFEFGKPKYEIDNFVQNFKAFVDVNAPGSQDVPEVEPEPEKEEEKTEKAETETQAQPGKPKTS